MGAHDFGQHRTLSARGMHAGHVGAAARGAAVLRQCGAVAGACPGTRYCNRKIHAWVIFSLEESPDLDGSALESLGEFAAWLSARQIEMRVARLKDASRDALMRANFSQLPPAGLDYSSVDDAVAASPCVTCP